VPEAPTPTFVKQNASMLNLYRRLRHAGSSIYKKYTLRQIIMSADPTNSRRSISEIAKLLSTQHVCDLTLERLFELLHNMSLQQDMEEFEGVINYLAATVEAYIMRRRNIFAILGGNEADCQQLNNFNTAYFNKTGLDSTVHTE
jgi:hypothetical protein